MWRCAASRPVDLDVRMLGPAGGMRRHAAAFSLIELVAVICIVAVLAAVLAERLLTYQERAEKSAMEQVVGVLRSALLIRAAGLLMAGRPEDVKQLETENPMSWLAERPENYGGVFVGPSLNTLSVGKWYFDRRDASLVYVPARTRHFVSGNGGEAAIRFRVSIDVGPLPREPGRPNPLRGPGRMELAAIEAYNWFQDLDD
jgi:general secretion pathway protein G